MGCFNLHITIRQLYPGLVSLDASCHIRNGLCTTGANLYLCARNAEHLAQVAEECKKIGAESVTTMSVREEPVSSLFRACEMERLKFTESMTAQ